MACLKSTIRILYVDDDPDDAVILRSDLEEAGFYNLITFLPKECPKGIMDHLREQREEVPDAVIIDVMLGCCEGIDLLRMIRNSEFRHLPVILVSGAREYLDQLQHRHDGLKADGLLTKPINIDELSTALKPFSHCLEEGV
jgi:CheY-like chemotaxis protein